MQEATNKLDNFCDYKQSIAQNRHLLTGDFRDRSLNSQSLPLTSRDNWKNLLSQIHEQVSDIPTQSNFTPFAETAIGYPELLQHIDPQIELLRRADSHWDRAFHLYSTLAMCRDAGGNSIA